MAMYDTCLGALSVKVKKSIVSDYSPKCNYTSTTFINTEVIIFSTLYQYEHFLILNLVEIWPDSTVTITIPPASASLFITIMRISIPGTKTWFLWGPKESKIAVSSVSKKKKEKRKNEKNQHWDHANAFEASSLMFVTKQTNVQTDKTKQKNKAN